MMHIYLKALVVSLLMVVAPVRSTTIEFQPVCDLVASSDVTLQVKVRSAEDLCAAKGWKCGGSLYKAIPVDGNNHLVITIVSSVDLKVGSSYTVFAERVQKGDLMSLYNPDHSEFIVPADVDYYVTLGSAFAFSGRYHYRELHESCAGDGPDCKLLNSLFPRGSESIVSASVRYPKFEEELLKCPR